MSLFPEDTEESPSPSSSSNSQNIQLAVLQDSAHTQMVLEQVALLHENLSFCQQVVAAVYDLSNYTPPNKTEKWDLLRPKLVKALVDDVTITNTIVETMGSINGLAILIRKSAELFNDSKYSPKAIEIIKENLPKSLDNLIQIKKRLESLNMNILKVFEENTQLIFELVGSAAAEGWAKNKQECSDTIKTKRDVIRKIEEEQATIEGEIDKMNNLAAVVRIQSGRKKEAIEEAKKETEDLKARRVRGEQLIDNIPAHITQRVETHHSSGWWFWRRRETSVHYQQVKNPDRDSEVAYLNGIINSRASRIKDIDNDKEKLEAMEKLLEEELGKCIGKIKELKVNLESYISGEKKNTINESVGEIGKQLLKMEEIQKEADKAENSFGLRGSVLVECLIAIRTFNKALGKGATVLQPLISLIGNIYANFIQHMQMIERAENPDEIFIGGKGLLKEVGLLNSCSGKLHVLMIGYSKQCSGFLLK